MDIKAQIETLEGERERITKASIGFNEKLADARTELMQSRAVVDELERLGRERKGRLSDIQQEIASWESRLMMSA